MPKISIITGVKDLSIRYMKTFESIEKQDFQDWEWVICDDGSTDDTWSRLNHLALKDHRIVLIKHQKSQGLAAALNSCLKVVKGKYIARMDDEDESMPNRISSEIIFLENHLKYDFVSTSFFVSDGHGNTNVVLTKKEPQKSSFLWTSPFMHPATMFRKSALQKVGGYRVAPETIRAEDYDLFMRMYAVGLVGCNLKQPLYMYYQDKNEVYKKEKYKYRIYEARVRERGFHELGIPIIESLPFIIKPLVVGLLPKKILYFNKTRRK